MVAQRALNLPEKEVAKARDLGRQAWVCHFVDQVLHHGRRRDEPELLEEPVAARAKIDGLDWGTVLGAFDGRLFPRFSLLLNDVNVGPVRDSAVREGEGAAQDAPIERELRRQHVREEGPDGLAEGVDLARENLVLEVEKDGHVGHNGLNGSQLAAFPLKWKKIELSKSLIGVGIQSKYSLKKFRFLLFVGRFL